MKKPPSPPLTSYGNVSEDPGVTVSSLVASPELKNFFESAAGVPSADRLSSMTIPRTGKKVCWRPNNYRRKINLGIALSEKRSRIQGCYTLVSYAAHSKLITIRDYPRVVLMVGKNYVTGIWCQNIVNGEKETFLIWSDSSEGVRERIAQKVEEIRQAIDAALYDFIDRFGFEVKGELPVWDRYEDWFRDEAYVSRLPRGNIVYDSYFKKVYEHGLEFTQSDKGEAPGEHLSRYVGNRALEDVAPGVAAELARLRLDVMREIAVLRKDIHALRPAVPAARLREQRRLGCWL